MSRPSIVWLQLSEAKPRHDFLFTICYFFVVLRALHGNKFFNFFAFLLFTFYFCLSFVYHIIKGVKQHRSQSFFELFVCHSCGSRNPDTTYAF